MSLLSSSELSLTDIFSLGKESDYLQIGLILLLVAFLIVGFVFIRTTINRRNVMKRKKTANRLGVVETYDLDNQRQMVIVHRDGVEHLLMIGGPNDLVIEAQITPEPAQQVVGITSLKQKPPELLTSATKVLPEKQNKPFNTKPQTVSPTFEPTTIQAAKKDTPAVITSKEKPANTYYSAKIDITPSKIDITPSKIDITPSKVDITPSKEVGKKSAAPNAIPAAERSFRNNNEEYATHLQSIEADMQKLLSRTKPQS